MERTIREIGEQSARDHGNAFAGEPRLERNNVSKGTRAPVRGRESGRESGRAGEIVVWKVWRRRLEGDDRGVVPKSSSKHLSKAEKPCVLAWTTGVFRGLLVRSHALS